MNEFQFAELLSGLRKEGYCDFAAIGGILPREKGSPMGRFCGKLPGAGSRTLCTGLRIKQRGSLQTSSPPLTFSKILSPMAKHLS